MNFVLVFYISVFLRTTFAVFTLGNVTAHFPIVQTLPTQSAVEEDPFYSQIIDIDHEASEATQQSHTSSSTTSMSLPITSRTSLSSPPSTTTAHITVRPKILKPTTTKAKKELLRQNRRRCNKLPTSRLKSTCRAIVEESLQDTAYLYVVTDESDRKGLFKSMRVLEIDGPRTSLTKGDLNCDRLTCPTTEQWLKKTLPQDRSTSPWTYCHNYDPDRIPAIISVAKCLCTGCMDRNTQGENMNYVSQEVKRHQRVLRKNPQLIDFSLCTDSTKLCWHDTESITVGCHCMMPTKKA